MKQSETDNRFPVFRERFREIQGDMSDTEFGKFLGISRQTVGFYGNGMRVPDALALKDIAEKCGVSADYLLGLSDAPTTDKTAAAAVDYTGLSARTVEFLHNMQNAPLGPFYEFARAVDFLIDDANYKSSNADYSPLLKMISAYMELDSGKSKSVYILNANGEIKKAPSDVLPDGTRYTRIPAHTVAFDSDMTDAIALTAISQKLTAMKRKRRQEKSE